MPPLADRIVIRDTELASRRLVAERIEPQQSATSCEHGAAKDYQGSGTRTGD